MRMYLFILPMLIRSEGVGLRLQNRRERGKNKKTKNNNAFCFRLCCLKLYVWEGGRAVNKFRDECFPHVCTWSDMYNFLEDFLWVAAPSQSQFWSYVKSLAWHPMFCCDTEMKHTICLCFFTRNTVILPDVLHSFNLTSFEAKTVEIPHLLHNFEAKTVVLPRFLQSFKAKAVVSPHSLHFPHSLKPRLWYVFMSCIITTRFAQSET